MSTLYQFGLAQAFLLGLCDGNWRFDQIKTYGNFGHGTFNAVDGELIVLDGKFYRIDATGKAAEVKNDAQTPICTLIHFEPTHQSKLRDVSSYQALGEILLTEIQSLNCISALRIDAVFSDLWVRSEIPQTKPYQPLDKTFLQTQRKLHHQNIQGTLVGFYTPKYFSGIVLPGFHFHFIDEARTCGGHVLDLKFQEAKLSCQAVSKVELFLPETEAFQHMNLDVDSSTALHVAEKGES